MSKHPLILLDDGYKSWRILKPQYDFGEPIDSTGFGGIEDRRYTEQTVVKGTLKEALEVLHQLERGRH